MLLQIMKGIFFGFFNDYRITYYTSHHLQIVIVKFYFILLLNYKIVSKSVHTPPSPYTSRVQ